MSNKYDEPPAYSQGGPQQPQPAYQGYNQGYQQGYPPQGGYYQQNPQMGYHQQGQYGPYPPQQGYYGPGGYPPQGQYRYDDRRSGPGCFEALLASLACCCCLDLCLF